MKREEDKNKLIIPTWNLPEDEERYINIPITLLKGMFEDQYNAIQKISLFCLYQHAIERLHIGTQVERIIIAGEFYHLSVNPENAEWILYHGRQLYREWLKSNSPRGGIKLKTFFAFFNDHNTEFQLIIYCALVSLKSIQQKAIYKKSSFDALFARMSGYSSIDSANGKIPEIIQKYQSRYFRSKIIQQLEVRWHLAYEADHVRGFYFSFKMNHEELCHAIQKQKQRKNQVYIDKAKEKSETRERVRQQYVNPTIPGTVKV